MYRLLFNVALTRVEPERAHELAKRALRATRSTAAGRAMMRRLAGRADPSLEVRALGRSFRSPLGVAAGVDKDATWRDDLAALGFGFVEVGTVTALAQPGNAKPRVARLVEERALVNRMGFPNPGADVVADRLGRGARGGVVGVNVGKSMAVALEEAAADYRGAVARLAPVADFLVLNVSSPNTPGLREMHAPELLSGLFAAVREELARAAVAIPLLVKISPDLDDEQVDAIARLALDLELDGIVAVNTTVERGVLGPRGRDEVPFEGGGVSGRPLRPRAVEVLRRLHAVVGRRLVLVSVGGIESAADVWERIVAGASLVQVYTAFVYGGPAWASRVNRELARMVLETGATSIQELVGTGAVSARPASAAT
jgi:dihydroorotate dehydrogenase